MEKFDKSRLERMAMGPTGRSPTERSHHAGGGMPMMAKKRSFLPVEKAVMKVSGMPEEKMAMANKGGHMHQKMHKDHKKKEHDGREHHFIGSLVAGLAPLAIQGLGKLFGFNEGGSTKMHKGK